MNHPGPARLRQYLFYGIDAGHEVEGHLRSCRECADLASDLLFETPNQDEAQAVLGRVRTERRDNGDSC